ncbi:MAG TPA: tetratricopeptide repeat protein [Pyrinomonadaceae bacterium]|nr:tetratricopeptide repeat protein [Pyrinomonadaceae bacterium]
MKTCQQCGRVYNDGTLKFCLEDGTVLSDLDETEEPSTAILPGVVPSEAPKRDRISSGPARTLLYVLAMGGLLAVAAFIGYRYWSPEKQIKSIAVIPFVNQSGDTELEYLSDGLTESLISSLSQLPELNVKARTSVFRYKGKEIDPLSTGRELSVQAILTGRLVKQDNSVTLYTELVDTSTENTLWTGSYTRPLANVVLLQNELARDVAAKLQARFSGADQKRLSSPQTKNEEAYRLYLAGRYHLNRLTDDGFRKGAEHFAQAIAKDPGYALAHAGLADAYNRLGGFNAAPPKESFPKAKDAALKAIELDSSLAEAHTALGLVKLFYDWDWANAEKEFRRAIELNPGYADGHMTYGLYLSLMNRFDDALTETRKAQELDPLSLEKQIGIGDVFFAERRYDDALKEYQKGLEMDPNSGLVNWALGRAYLEKGMYPEAIAAFQRSIPLSGESPDESVDLARAYARDGKRAEAIKILDDLTRSSQARYISPTTIGSIYVALGENDKAFEWFDRAFLQRDYLLVMTKVDPMFDNVRSDPRFAALMQRVGL